MTTEAITRDPAFVARIQEILDHSATTATPGVGRTFARDDWRLDAERFLDAWHEQRACTVASVGPKGQPHLAMIHADFQPDGRMTMRMFTNSVRRTDFLENNRVALQKNFDGAVMTVYGRAKVVPGTETLSRGVESVEVEIEPTRIYAMKPQGGR
ncbi:MAG: pyridoxamine 5'-phosphate oxidase family protein [Dehalococcoidia bacterium]